MSARSYKSSSLEERWDAIVIGSGMGGMTTAALLSKCAGKRVLVLERHYVCGGYTHIFHRPGYEWDVGLHYIGEVHDTGSSVRKTFDFLTDGKLAWSRMPDVYDRIIIGDRAYDFVAGVDRFRERLKGYFPKEARAIDRYVATVQSAARFTNLYFAEKVIPPFLSALMGGILRMPFLRGARRTTAEVLDGLTDNPELKGVLSGQWGDYGLPPKQSSFGIHAIIANHYLEGAAYPVGGAARIAETVVPVIEANGGKVFVNAMVAAIVVKGGKAVGIRMEDGAEFLAPVIVSNTGVLHTFGQLLPQDHAPAASVLCLVKNIGPSPAHLCLYVGMKQARPEGTNLWVLPGYDHDASTAKFSADSSSPFPFLFLSFPSAKDPDFERRYPGRATAEVVAPVPYEWFAAWEHTRWKKRLADYEALKGQFAERMQRELETHVPMAVGKIEVAELSTPLTTRHFMNYARGEIYGLASTPERFGLRCLKPRTPISNLYLSGQDIATLGVTGAMFGGVLAASAILKRNLMSAFT
jgi:all-trans-retinol 13,14-reductase